MSVETKGRFAGFVVKQNINLLWWCGLVIILWCTTLYIFFFFFFAKSACKKIDVLSLSHKKCSSLSLSLPNIYPVNKIWERVSRSPLCWYFFLCPILLRYTFVISLYKLKIKKKKEKWIGLCCLHVVYYWTHPPPLPVFLTHNAMGTPTVQVSVPTFCVRSVMNVFCMRMVSMAPVLTVSAPPVFFFFFFFLCTIYLWVFFFL